MKHKVAVFIVAAAPTAIALIAAAFVSFASGSPYSSRTYGSAATASAPGIAGAATDRIANSPVGRIVVDSKGSTLDPFEKGKNRRSACYGQCATYWPPLLTHRNPVARGSGRQVLLEVIRRPSGSEEVTFESKGEGSQAFGASRDVLSPAGKRIETGG